MDNNLRLKPTAMQLFNFESFYTHFIMKNKWIMTSGIAVIEVPENLWTSKPKPILEQTFQLTGVQTHKIKNVSEGVYLQYSEENIAKYTPKEFFEASKLYIPESEQNNIDVLNPIRDISLTDLNKYERNLYANLLNHDQLYGSSFDQTLFTSGQISMNLNEIIKSNPISLSCKESPGITKPMILYATYLSTFVLHSENNNLAAINYLHWGAPKVWFAIPNKYYLQVVALVKILYWNCDDHRKDCANWPAHKVIFLHPSVLEKHQIPYTRVCSLRKHAFCSIQLLILLFTSFADYTTSWRICCWRPWCFSYGL